MKRAKMREITAIDYQFLATVNFKLKYTVIQCISNQIHQHYESTSIFVFKIYTLKECVNHSTTRHT